MKKQLNLGDETLTFDNEIIRRVEFFDDLCIVIFEILEPKENISYNNVIAIDTNKAEIIWEIERDEKLDKFNPYMVVFDAGFYLLFQKSNDTRYAINKSNGKIIRSIDLNTGRRPW